MARTLEDELSHEEALYDDWGGEACTWTLWRTQEDIEG